MDNRKFVLSQTLTVLIGELILSALMVAVFAVLGYFDFSVVLGAAAGIVIATVNHLVLILGVMAASTKAEKQDVKGGQATIKGSYMLRMIGMFVVLFAFAKSGLCNVIALVVPLVFSRFTLTLQEFFRRKPGEKTE